MNRIICIGNRYLRQDAAGAAVHDMLLRQPLPPDTELIDGGIAGLNLLGLFEGVRRVVLVDVVSGFGEQHGPVVLQPNDIAPLASTAFDHAAGLPYLLRILPDVLEGAMPAIEIVGIEASASGDMIRRTTELVIERCQDGQVMNERQASNN